MGDSYREEKARHHKISGFRAVPAHFGDDVRGALSARRRSLRQRVLKEQANWAKRVETAKKQRRLMDA